MSLLCYVRRGRSETEAVKQLTKDLERWGGAPGGVGSVPHCCKGGSRGRKRITRPRGGGIRKDLSVTWRSRMESIGWEGGCERVRPWEAVACGFARLTFQSCMVGGVGPQRKEMSRCAVEGTQTRSGSGFAMVVYPWWWWRWRYFGAERNGYKVDREERPASEGMEERGSR